MVLFVLIFKNSMLIDNCLRNFYNMSNNSCCLIHVDGPPEFFISGVTSIPVIRTTSTTSSSVPSIENFDERRKDLSLFKLEAMTQEDFNILLFSDKFFLLDVFDKQKLLVLLDKAVADSGFLDLKVEVFFEAHNDVFLMVSKLFYTLDSKPYIFSDKKSSSYFVVGRFGYFDFSSLSVYDNSNLCYKKTLYQFEEKLYTQLSINHPEMNKILPLAITYDEFGIVCVNYYYNGKLIEHDILKNIKFDFDARKSSFDYFTHNEICTLKMYIE